LGNAAEARRRAAAALGLPNGRDVQYAAALALAFAGDTTRRVHILADDLVKRWRDDTIAKFNYLPTIRAQIALNRNDASQAIDVLQAAAPYELGLPGSAAFSPGLYPVYVRAQAYLTAQDGNEAASEFQKILDHPGIMLNELIGAASRSWPRLCSFWRNRQPKSPIKTSSPSGKTPTLTSRS